MSNSKHNSWAAYTDKSLPPTPIPKKKPDTNKPLPRIPIPISKYYVKLYKNKQTKNPARSNKPNEKYTARCNDESNYESKSKDKKSDNENTGSVRLGTPFLNFDQETTFSLNPEAEENPNQPKKKGKGKKVRFI